jgi:hypothetical protein
LAIARRISLATYSWSRVRSWRSTLTQARVTASHNASGVIPERWPTQRLRRIKAVDFEFESPFSIRMRR